MGDPKKAKKKYETPKHPWEGDRIEEEKELKSEYGLKNKKEIMKMKSILKGLKGQAKVYNAAIGKQAELERKQLLERVQRLGIIEGVVTLDDILGLKVNAIMERRLQTVLFRKGLCRSAGQARQFIIHRHVIVADKKITMPSYLVTKEEEKHVAFVAKSTLSNDEHPERVPIEKKEKKRKNIDERNQYGKSGKRFGRSARPRTPIKRR
ncbi:MAG: 30S ribosomal protein S4 [archaeon]